MDNDAKFYGEWVADRGRRLYLWNYFHHPMERAILQGWKCFPCFMPDVISHWVKRYAQDGVRGFYLCGIGQQLDYYLYMQTAFNAETDYRQLVNEFFSRYFGAAGEPMKAFYYRISEINREEHVLGTTPKASWDRLGTKAHMQELGNLMNRAVDLAQTDLERRRVETWKQGVWDYMAEGRRQYLKEKRAREKKEFPIRIYNTGVDDNHKGLADQAADLHWRLIKSADSTWKGPQTYTARSDAAPIPPWIANSATSKWITPRLNGTDVSNGRYIYVQTFSLDGFDSETASLVGRVAADDLVDHLEINGVNVGQGGGSFTAWSEFVVADHFFPGTNTLRIVVKNSGNAANPHGLRVELDGSADGKH